MKTIVYTLFFILSFFATAQNQQIFKEANALYNAGKYAEAIDKYQTILNANQQSAELYFNLGNANYKLNNIAPSIYYYEKALQLQPKDTDIINNLAFAKNMTVDVIDTVPQGPVEKFIKALTNTLTFNGWAKLAVGLVFCFILLFLFYYFAYSSLKKRLAFIASLVALLLVCLSLLFAFHSYNLDRLDKPAIVFAQESKINSEPNSRSEEVFRLHEGTKVQILDTVQDWKKIKLTDGKTGWISSNDIKAL